VIWYVARNPDKSIAAAFSYEQPGYADEALDDQASPEMIAFRQQVTAVPALTVDQKLAEIGLSVAILTAAIQAVPAPPAQQDTSA
jgi:hypothetical protein